MYFLRHLTLVHKTAMVSLYPCNVRWMLSPRHSAGSQFVRVDMQRTTTTCSGAMIFCIAHTDSINWSGFPSFFISSLCSIRQNTLQGCTHKFDRLIFRYYIQYFVFHGIGIFVSLLDILYCYSIRLLVRCMNAALSGVYFILFFCNNIRLLN